MLLLLIILLQKVLLSECVFVDGFCNSGLGSCNPDQTCNGNHPCVSDPPPLGTCCPQGQVQNFTTTVIPTTTLSTTPTTPSAPTTPSTPTTTPTTPSTVPTVPTTRTVPTIPPTAFTTVTGAATTPPNGVGTCVDSVNPKTGVSECPGMLSYCQNSIYYDMMTTQCPRTCNRCGITTTDKSVSTCNDRVSPMTGVSECPGMLSYCNNTIYYTLMTEQCPLTCNRCGLTTTMAVASTTASTCMDKINPYTGVSDCPGMVSFCNDPTYLSLMIDQCPKTCGRCGIVAITAATTAPSTCVDKINPNTGVSDCPGMASFCNDPTYLSLMNDQCPKTCNRCGIVSATAPPVASCADLLNPNTGVSDCPGMASFCNDATYLTLMKQQCPKTCGLCSSG